MKRSLFVLLCVLCCATTAPGQSTSAELRGVIERDGSPAAGLTVSLRNPAGVVLVELVSDAGGRFSARNLPAGSVSIAIGEGESLRACDIVLAAGAVTVVRLRDDGDELRQLIDGFAAPDYRGDERIVVFDTAFLNRLPLPLGFARMRPLLSWVSDEIHPRIHGGTPRENVWRLDGIDLTDADEGIFSGPLAPYEATAMEQIAGSGIDIVTRSGGPTVHGSGSLYYLSSGFPEEIESLSYERERDLFASSMGLGSSWRSLSWFIAATWHREDFRETPGRLEAEERTAPLSLIRVQYQPLQNLSLDMILGGHDDTRRHAYAPDTASVNVTAPRGEASSSDIHTGWYGAAHALYRLRPEIAAFAAASFVVDDFTIQPANGSRANSSILDTDSVKSSLIAGSWQPLWREDRQRRYTLYAGATADVSFFGEHALSFEAGSANTDIDRDFAYNGGWRYDWSPLTGQAWRRVSLMQDGAPAVAQSISNERLHLLIGDRWSLFGRITLSASALIESIRGGNGMDDGIFSWDTVAPRFGLAWDVMGDGGTVLDVTVARQYNPLRGVNIPGDSYQIGTGYWDSASASWSTSPLNNTRAAGYDPAGVDADIERPYWDEIRMGLSRRLGPQATLILDARNRKQFDLFEDVETNLWDFYGSGTGYDELNNSYRYYVVRPGANGTRIPVYFLRTVPGLEREYLGLDVILRADLQPDLQMYGAYTWSRSRGTIDSSLAESSGYSAAWNSPNERINAEGYLSGDQRHALRLAAVWRAPWDIVVSALLRFDSGRPLDRLLLNHDTGRWEIRGDERGSVFRTPAMTTVDLHLEKLIAVGDSQLTAILDVFNLSDDDTASEFMLIDDLIGRPLAAREPRSLRWGLRLNF